MSANPPTDGFAVAKLAASAASWTDFRWPAWRIGRWAGWQLDIRLPHRPISQFGEFTPLSQKSFKKVLTPKTGIGITRTLL
jgi:hypothetical protein